MVPNFFILYLKGPYRKRKREGKREIYFHLTLIEKLCDLCSHLSQNSLFAIKLSITILNLQIRFFDWFEFALIAWHYCRFVFICFMLHKNGPCSVESIQGPRLVWYPLGVSSCVPWVMLLFKWDNNHISVSQSGRKNNKTKLSGQDGNLRNKNAQTVMVKHRER